MNQKKASVSEYRNVKDTIAKYIDSLRTGSVDRLTDTFHKNAVTYGTVDGGLVGGADTNPVADFIRVNGKSPDIEAHIDVLDITPSTAVVRVVTENDAIGTDCIEYLTLIKLSEAWAVVAKVFHQFEN
ncbi:MAG: nuclear transport factor 2 family protein [Burkholderiaceae bacterium]|nr:nuclear transport factor 2 family protein [Burkholderiaceae bacterium]